MENWCIKLDAENRDVVIHYLNKKYDVFFEGRANYYGVNKCNSADYWTDKRSTLAEITTEQFIEMVKKEGYKVEQNNFTYQWEFTHKPKDNILGTSKNNPPINKFLSELYKDTKEVQSDGGSTQYYQITITNDKGESFNCELNDILRDVFNNQWDLCNIVKASRRISEARQGKGKKDVSIKYDANKIIWFAEEIKKLNKYL